MDKQKSDIVSGKFLVCTRNFSIFTKGVSYWLEYVGNDNYIDRSDNILGTTVHISPEELIGNFAMRVRDL